MKELWQLTLVSTWWIWNPLRFKPLGRCVCECVPRKNWEGRRCSHRMLDWHFLEGGRWHIYIWRRSRKRQLGLLVEPALPLPLAGEFPSSCVYCHAPLTSESNFCLPRCTEEEKLSQHPPVPDWGSWGIWLPELCSYWIPSFSSVQVAIVGLPSVYSISYSSKSPLIIFIHLSFCTSISTHL